MQNEILNQFFHIQSSTIDDVKVLLKDIKEQKNLELIKKVQDLENQLKKLQKSKRYGLVWEDKPEIFEQRAKKALPILQEDKTLRIEESEQKPNNLIIEGDNFHALSALSYTHKGKIDVIYIDPPYNTGNKDFIYNDRYVDKEDNYRHSKWLSFMNKRLRIAKDLLTENGVIFISIDDNEQAQLKLLCDDIFGEENFIANLIWQKKNSGGQHATRFLDFHEYVLCYSKDNSTLEDFKVNRTEEQLKSFKLKDEYFQIRGRYLLSPLKSWLEYRKNLIYPINCPDGKYIETQWTCGKDKYLELLNEGRIEFKKGKDGDRTIYKKQYENDRGGFTKPGSMLLDVAQSQNGTRDLSNIFGEKSLFSNPKPYLLIKYLLGIVSLPNSTILDFFAGSGTTGHAVMELNKEDGGSRQFILCSSRENTKEEPEKNICRHITYERNKKIIEGYTNSKGEPIEGLGGNLRYYTTEFIKTDTSIDDLRYSFINMCDDLLCIKENTFTEVKLKDQIPELKLFKKSNQYMAILYDIYHFKDLIKILEILHAPVSVYVFSLSKDIFEEELERFPHVTVQNIPDDILSTYKKIFNF